MRTFILHIFLLVFLQGTAQELLTFDDALRIGLEQNFDIRIASNERRVADNNLTRGNAGFLPEISWSGTRNYNRLSVNQQFISGNTNENPNAKSNSWNTGVDASWTIFDGMRMFRTYERLDALRDLSLLDEQIAVENAAFDIAVAYYEIVLQKSRLNAIDTTLLLSSERMDFARTRYEVGKAPKLDYLSAQVDYNTDFTSLVQQTELVQRAKHDLNNVMGRDINEDFVVPNAIELDSTLQLGALKTLALSENKSLQRLKMTGEVLNLEAEEIKGEKYPSVDLNLGYSYNRQASEAGFLLSNRTSGVNYGISATWNLFNGNDVQRRYANALIDIENNLTRLEQLELMIVRDIENAYLNYANSLELVQLEQENLAVSRESVDIALDRYRLGKTTFLELREAQVNAVTNFTRLFDAIHATKVAELQLLLLSGQIVR